MEADPGPEEMPGGEAKGSVPGVGEEAAGAAGREGSIERRGKCVLLTKNARENCAVH